MSDILDPGIIDTLRELEGDEHPCLLVELIDLFFEDAPERVAAMRAGMNERDADGAAKAAHTLKGASSNLGAKRLSALCQMLEQDVRAERYEDAGGTLTRLERELDTVYEALRAERRQAAGD